VWEASHLDPSQYRELSARFEALRAPHDRPVTRSLEVDVVTAPTAEGRTRLEASFLAERGDGGPALLARALAGPPDAVSARLTAFVDAGVDRFLAACVDPLDTGSLEALAAAAAAVAWPAGEVGCARAGGPRTPGPEAPC
jgi:hypothetical protein